MKNPKLEINFKSLQLNNRGTSWQKAIFGVVLISLLFYILACGYLFFRPIAAATKTSIDNEISASNVTFDKKTLDMLKLRQEPAANTQSSTGKNPFTPF